MLQFGRYRVESELGKGGFGVVYLATDEELQRRVAIKVASRGLDQQDAESYLSEARTVATLDHPHIVPVYDVGRTDQGQIYVVSRLIEGSDLKTRIAQELPLASQAVTWIATLADALHYAHTKGLVHRDVKPGKVLAEFGKAYGRLPENLGQHDAEQERFLDDAVTGLSTDGKVISVRLALFAEMVKAKPWTPATLRQLGGISGVGVVFLEETFSAASASPAHRHHQRAARAVLAELLPDEATNIKGRWRSDDQLREVSGYAGRPSDFADLIRILDTQLRLITPTDLEGAMLDADNVPVEQVKAGAVYFQLTHDFLVPSLRDWLTRKQQETRSGRAELKLAERSVIWTAKRENKQLPSTLEWLQIRWHSDRRKWTEPQRTMMRKAAKLHGITWGGTLAAFLAVGLTVQYWVSQRDWNNKRDQTRIAVESLQNNLGPSIPVNIGELRKLPESLVLGELVERFPPDNPRHKLALSFALAAYGRVETEYLVSRIDDIAIVDTANFVDALALDRERALAAIKAEADGCVSESLWRRKAKLAIAALALGDADIAADMCQYEDRPDPGQRTIFIHEFPQWEWHLSNRTFDLSQLAESVAESKASGLRSGISLAVGSIPVGQIQELNPTALGSWSGLASRWVTEHSDTSTHSAAKWLLRQWQRPQPMVADQTQVRTDRDWFVNSAGMTMLRIRPPALEPQPEITLDDPLESFRRQLVALRDLTKEQMPESQLRIRALAYFQTGDYAAALDDVESLLEDPTMSNPDQLPIYRILALSHLGRHDDAVAAYETVRETLSKSLDMYLKIQLAAFRGDSTTSLELLGQAASDETLNDDELYDAACAAALCAKSLTETDAGTSQRFKRLALELLAKSIGAGYSDGQHLGQDADFLVLHREPEFRSLVGKINQQDGGTALPKSEYWIASCEVTRGQFETFMQDSNYNFEKPTDWDGVDTEISPTADHPAQQVSWYDSVMYCNWLSRQEGKQPAYRKTGKKDFETIDGEEYYDQWELVPSETGYRLLWESEWEFAARAGSTSDWSSGSDEQLLVDYCHMYPSKRSAEVGRKLPNAWGLHDMHGNVWELCNDLDLRDADRAFRVLRGGSWNGGAAYCRAAYRGTGTPSYRYTSDGLRLALSPSSQVTAEPVQAGEAEPLSGGTEGVAEQRPQLP